MIQEKIKKLAENYKSIEELVNKNIDIIGSEYQYLKIEKGFHSADEIKKVLGDKLKKDRLLKIGLIGRVKAGKSSLLNSLFFEGKNILPKAATPMTAALTILTYGDTPKAEVELFTTEDIQELENKAREFKNLLENEKNNILKKEQERKSLKESFKKLKEEIKSLAKKEDLEKKAEIKALRNLKEKYFELYSANEQLEQIHQSNLNHSNLNSIIEIEKNDIDELKNELSKFISSNGEFTPFTKSVKLYLPIESLKELEIVDTPGLNDPVRSREQRTRVLIKECDVILIASLAGQFLTNQDKQLLFRINTKEGIREIFILPTQIDNELFSSIRDKAEGDLDTALQLMKKELSSHAHETIDKIVKENEETKDAFSQLAKETNKRLILTSSICHAIALQWDNRGNWDEQMKHIWKLLKENYPDNFKDNNKQISLASLHKIANYEKLSNIIKDVKTRKEKILQEYIDNKIEAYTKNAIDLLNSIANYLNEQEEKINTQSIKELQEQAEKIQKIFDQKGKEINHNFLDIFDDWSREIKIILNREISNIFESTKRESKNSKETHTETIVVKKKGLWNWVKRWTGIGDGGIRTEKITIKSISTSHIKTLIEADSEKTERKIKETYENEKNKFKKELMYREFLKRLRDPQLIGIDDKYINLSQFKKATLIILDDIVPELKIGKPEFYSEDEILYHDEVNKFLSKVSLYIEKLKTSFLDAVNNLNRELKQKFEEKDMARLIFEHLINELNTLENQIKNKQLTLKRFANLKNEIITLQNKLKEE